MWGGTGSDERGSGGPVLRDPRASRSQPYNNLSNRSFNRNDNFDENIWNTSTDHFSFPPAHNETQFPPVSNNQLQPAAAPTPPPLMNMSMRLPNSFGNIRTPFPEIRHQTPFSAVHHQTPFPEIRHQTPFSAVQHQTPFPAVRTQTPPLTNQTYNPFDHFQSNFNSNRRPFFQQPQDRSNAPPQVRPAIATAPVQQVPPLLPGPFLNNSQFSFGANHNQVMGSAQALPKPNFQQERGNNANISISLTESQKPAPRPILRMSSNCSFTARNGHQVQISSNSNKKPLLPTPKFVPYPPPPPVSKSSSDMPGKPILRNPRGILKTPTQSYSNFIAEGKSVSDNRSNISRNNSRTITSNNSSGRYFTVVPYTIGEDEDDGGEEDEDDVELVAETGETQTVEPTHDFFSKRMVDHFSSLLNGKPLEQQMQELMTHLVLPPDYLTSRVNIVRNLHLMLQDTFKKCCVRPYGADFIGVGSSDDSVNMFIDLTGKQGSVETIEPTNITPMQLTDENIEQLINLIQEDEHHKFFGQIVRRTNYNYYRANVPVISFIHSDSQVRCNLRLDNYLLVQEAKVIQFICSLDPRIIPLIALTRYWSSVHKVLDTPAEDTKNRFVILLMLFFLAHKKIIPTMAELQSLSVKREYFDNIDIAFCGDYSLVPHNENPALEDKTVFTLSTVSLLKEFFKLFSTTNFQTDVVSLWKAEFIPKEYFRPDLEDKMFPADFKKRYRFAANGCKKGKRIDCSSRLCIQDFQDLSDNLSLAVAEYEVSKFQLECEIALKKLDDIMNTGAGNLMDLFAISEEEIVGTAEHLVIHEIVYFLGKLSEKRLNIAKSKEADENIDSEKGQNNQSNCETVSALLPQ